MSNATSPFREEEPPYHPTWGLALPVPTADTVPLLRAARAALGHTPYGPPIATSERGWYCWS